MTTVPDMDGFDHPPTPLPPRTHLDPGVVCAPALLYVLTRFWLRVVSPWCGAAVSVSPRIGMVLCNGLVTF